MELVVPWPELQAWIEPHYTKGAMAVILSGSVSCCGSTLQQWFKLSDPGVEKMLYESPVLRRFVGVDLGRAAMPDETNICRFRYLLEKHELGGAMLDRVNEHLATKRIKIATGTTGGATILHAPSSTKNDKKECDRAMRQTRKGQQ